MNTISNNQRLADEIIDGNLDKSTKAQYKRKVDHFAGWLGKYYPDVLIANEGETNKKIDATKVTCAQMKQFFGHVAKKTKKAGRGEPKLPLWEAPYEEPAQFNSYEHVSGYKSAIKKYYFSERVVLTKEIEDMLKDFFNGYERKIADLKENGEMSLTEGKAPLTFNAYKWAAKKAITAGTELGIFAHLFLLLSWNLIARCSSVAKLMYSHISWEEDCMIVKFPSHKGDKEGKDCLPKHVYANTVQPEICPILSLAIYVFTLGFRRTGSKQMVFSEDVDSAETRFSKWLKNICSIHGADILSFGLLLIEIGTHSFRKGAATFLSTIAGGPTAIAVYLRAGWSLGVQSRYIKPLLMGDGGDQVVGRAATGLSLLDAEFASLPPHFTKEVSQVLTDQVWDTILPGYSSFFPELFRPVLSYLAASICYHKTWLQTNLPQSHPLFMSSFWTSNAFAKLHSFVQAGCGRNHITGLTATGIPPHILLANEISNIRKDVAAMKLELIDKLTQLPDKVKETMLHNFKVDGVVPITADEVANMIERLRLSIVDAMKAQATTLRDSIVESNLPTNTVENGNNFEVFTWGGRIHNVPADFNFPVCNAQTCWDLWWAGNAADKIAPYRFIRTFSLKKNKDYLSKAAKVMSKLLEMAEQTASTMAAASIVERRNYFARAITSLFKKIYPEKHEADFDRVRFGDVTYLRLYDLIVQIREDKVNSE